MEPSQRFWKPGTDGESGGQDRASAKARGRIREGGAWPVRAQAVMHQGETGWQENQQSAWLGVAGTSRVGFWGIHRSPGAGVVHSGNGQPLRKGWRG